MQNEDKILTQDDNNLRYVYRKEGNIMYPQNINIYVSNFTS